MQQLSIVMFAEGNTDTRFLNGVIQRTIFQLIADYGQFANWEVPDNLEIKTKADYKDIAKEEEKVLQVAKDYANFDMLILHADADNRPRKDAYKYHFEPGVKLVAAERAKNIKVVEQMLPIIPVRNIEAWILADGKALKEVLSIDTAKLSDLPTSAKPKDVENLDKPKQALENLVNKVNQTHRKKVTVTEVYEPMGREIDLAVLEKVPAYRQFKQDLEKVLTAIGLVKI